MASPVVKHLGTIMAHDTGQGHYVDYEKLYNQALTHLKRREDLAVRLERLISDLDLRKFPHREEVLRILMQLRGG